MRPDDRRYDCEKRVTHSISALREAEFDRDYERMGKESRRYALFGPAEPVVIAGVDEAAANMQIV